MWKSITVVLFVVWNTCQGQSEPWNVTIHPPNQKVSENSHVLLTCVSSRHDVEIIWEVKKKTAWTEIVDGTDDISVSDPRDGVSTLVIGHARTQKHKRQYRCRAVGPTGEKISANSKLRIARIDRIPKQFPKIAPIESARDILLPMTKQNTVEMLCRTALPGGASNQVTWHWIKDGNIDLGIHPDNPSRIQIGENGVLRINEMASSDSGDYTCVATNKYGTDYGTPFQLNVREAGPDGKCHPRDRPPMEVGEQYQPNSDPCHTCECHKGNKLICRIQQCIPPSCNGQPYIRAPGTCCDFSCPGDDPQTINDRTCRDHKGRIVAPGNFYQPTGYPCKNCMCENGRQGVCSAVQCAAPRCQNYTMSEDVCCEFTCHDKPRPHGVEARSCADRDGNKVIHGSSYLPEEDPCLRCVCNNGNRGQCMMVACVEPTCKNYVPSRDICCDYTCSEEREVNVGLPLLEEDRTCMDRDGNKVRHGSTYLPEDDPCLRCVCNHGNRELCTMVACVEPRCKNFVPSRDKCCDYTCVEDSEFDVMQPQSVVDTCMDYHGNRTANGSNYQPYKNPCERCLCVNGRPELCAEAVCDAPTCRNYILVEGTCCGFICPNNSDSGNNDAGPVELPVEEVTVKEGRLFVQQVGPRSALVQWQFPSVDIKSHLETTVTFRPLSHGNHNMAALEIHTYDAMALVPDLHLNTDYEVTIKSRKNSMTLIASTTIFTLDGRAKDSLRLNDAVGALFESRGAIAFGDISLPRKFDRVITDAKFIVSLNIASFHRAEVAFYDQAPCPKEVCGLIRFYMYDHDGTLKNVMSILFTDERDFNWAKAHL